MFERLATVVCVFLSAFLSCALTSAEFPSNPTYGTIFLYPDTSCKTMNTASSYVLDYCFGTGKYSCGEEFLFFYFSFVPTIDIFE